MAEIDDRLVEDVFVIQFGGKFERINAYTLASTLAGIADAAKAANSQINPGYDIEVLVEALGKGSFRTKVRAIYSGAGNLFSRDNLKAVVLSVIATFVYEQTLARDRDVSVHVSSDEVVIEQGDMRVVVPREVHEAKELVKDDSAFRIGIGRAIRAVEEDPAIEDVGFGTGDDPEPPVRIPRERFAQLSEGLPVKEQELREIQEVTTLRILRAILERSRRRWQFVWHGVTVSAPVLDDAFYDHFFARRITIAPGDALKVRLNIRQRLDPSIGVYLNEGYEVVEVLQHVPRAEQDDLELGQAG